METKDRDRRDRDATPVAWALLLFLLLSMTGSSEIAGDGSSATRLNQLTGTVCGFRTFATGEVEKMGCDW